MAERSTASGAPVRRSVRLSSEEAWQVTADSHTGILTTLRRDGQPISLPVWFVVHGGAILVSTPAGAKKLARIRNDPRCSFLVESGKRWAELVGVQWTGPATVHEDDDPLVAGVRDAMDAKYAPFRTLREDMPAETAGAYERRGEHTLIRLVPEGRVLSWDNARLGL